MLFDVLEKTTETLDFNVEVKWIWPASDEFSKIDFNLKL